MINTLLVSGMTILVFVFFRRVYRSKPLTILNPLLLSIFFTSTVLILFNIDYASYFTHALPIHWMLEVAVVCLAYPLYYQFNQLKSYLPILLLCSFMGITSATVLAFILCQVFNTPIELTQSLMALSVTTPITILTTQSLSGIGPIAAIMVILIGVFGALFGVYILNTINVKSPQAQGIALGVSCHAIGTAAALEQNPVCGAFASAAMTISAFITAIWVPILYTLLAAYS